MPKVKLDLKQFEKQYGNSLLQKLEQKAKDLRINTDIKKKIFFTLMTCEDFLDAFEKLLKLDLKKIQEWEIVKVII